MKFLKKLIKPLIALVILTGLFIGYISIFHTYKGNHYTAASDQPSIEFPIKRNGDENQNGISNEQEIAKAARELVGTLYDQLKGSRNNLGGKMGFIVCIDVPRIAYGKAGISLADQLKADFDANPEHYDTENGINTPDTEFFFRRVRNVYDYAKGNQMLIKQADTPKVGDIVFYGKYHATMVSAVYDDGTFDEVEAHPNLVFVKEHKRKTWEPRDVARFLE